MAEEETRSSDHQPAGEQAGMASNKPKGTSPSASGRKRQRRDKRGYLKDFKKQADGSYAYEGQMYRFDGTETARKALKKKLWLLSVMAMAATVSLGIIPTPGMRNTYYVILPFIGVLMSQVSVLYDLSVWSGSGRLVREYVVQQNVRRLPGRSFTGVVFAAALTVGSIVYRCVGQMDVSGARWALAAAVISAADLLLIIWQWRTLLRLRYKKTAEREKAGRQESKNAY